jgi:DNA modification methylase
LSIKLGYAPEKVVSWVYNSNTGKQHRDIAYYGVKPEFKNRGEEYKNPKDKRVMKLITSGKKPRLYDWWNVNQVKNVSKDKTPHPCQMPIEVMENILKTLPDDCIIIDPFMGSGTTGVACINTNRKFIGIEMDEKYYDISCKRIKNAIIEKEQELFKI